MIFDLFDPEREGKEKIEDWMVELEENVRTKNMFFKEC